MVRTRVDEVSTLGRNTQGVRLINLSEGESLVGLASFEEPELDELDSDFEDDSENESAAASESAVQSTPDDVLGDPAMTDPIDQGQALQALRLEIDRLDQELLTLLNRRAECALEVAAVKENRP